MSNPVMTDEWVQIARPEDIPLREGRAVTVAGTRIAVFRIPDSWVAIDAICPHRGGPLNDGLIAGDCVICPLHGQAFDLHTGEQQGGPDRVTVHEVIERDGILWLRVPSTT